MLNGKISAKQFGLISFISFITPIAFLRTSELNNNLTDSFYSILLSLVLCLLFSYPIFFLDKYSLKENKISKAIYILFILYFLFCIFLDLVKVTVMLTNTLIYEGNEVFISILMLITSFYGVYKGVECLARSAGIIFFFLVLGVLIISLSSLKNISLQEYRIPFEFGAEDFLTNSLLIFTSCSFIPQCFIIKNKINESEKYKIKYIVFIISAALLSAVLFLLVQYTLGYYGLTQKYPIYTLSAITSLEPIKRLDLIYIIIFVMGTILRVSFGLFASFSLFEKVINAKSKIKYKYIILISLIIPLFFVFRAEYILADEIILYVRFFLVFIFSIIAPLVLYLVGRRNKA